MKIDINQILPEGLTLVEEFTPAALDLETGIINFRGPIRVRAQVSKITNVITVHFTFDALMHTGCSRCLEEIEIEFKKSVTLNYPVDRAGSFVDDGQRLSASIEPGRTIDLNPYIKEEIILDYPIKPLCKLDCKGLCPKCGQNLNEGRCDC